MIMARASCRALSGCACIHPITPEITLETPEKHQRNAKKTAKTVCLLQFLRTQLQLGAAPATLVLGPGKKGVRYHLAKLFQAVRLLGIQGLA